MKNFFAQSRFYKNGNQKKNITISVFGGTFLFLCGFFGILSGCAPSSGEQIFKKGVKLERAGLYAEALETFAQAVTVDPNYFLAHKHRGDIYSKQANQEKALDEYHKAIEISPGHAFLYYNRGLIYYQQRDFNRAINDYTKAIEINSEYADAFLNRGVAFVGQGQFNAAISDYSRVIELNPEYAKAYLNRGIAYLGKRNPDQARLDFDRALKLDSSLQDELGKVKENLPEEIFLSPPDIQRYKDLIEKEPDNYEHHIYLASLYGQRGAGRLAARHAEMAISLNPEKALEKGAYHMASMGYYYDGQFRKSYEMIQKAFAATPDHEMVKAFKDMLESIVAERFDGEIPERIRFGEGYPSALDVLMAIQNRGEGVLNFNGTDEDVAVFDKVRVFVTAPLDWQKTSNVQFTLHDKAFLLYNKSEKNRLPQISLSKDLAGPTIQSVMDFSYMVKKAMERKFPNLKILGPRELSINHYKASYLDARDEQNSVRNVWYQFLVGKIIVSLQYTNRLDQDQGDYQSFEQFVQSIRIESENEY